MTDFNASDQDVTRAIRSWLHEDRHEDVSRIAGAVLDQVETTRQRRATWWPARRTPTMNKIVGFGAAAAAVVVALVIGTQFLGPPTPIGVGGGPSAEPSPTAVPSLSAAEPSPSIEADLDEGPFLFFDAQGITVTVTIPAPGWYGEAKGGSLAKNANIQPPDGAYMLGPWGGEDAGYIPGDPCQWLSTMPETPATTVDEVVAALASQASRDASEPVDITLDGHAGKSITLHVPDDVVFANGEFTDCNQEGGGRHAFCTFGTPTDCYMWNAQGPGAIDELWIVDLDGQLLIMDGAYYAQTPAEDVDELRAILGSMSFGR
jgi:hypothetical protein